MQRAAASIFFCLYLLPHFRFALRDLAELLDEQIPLTREIISEYDKLLPFSMEATLSAKQEFGIRIEEVRYAKFTTESAQEVKTSVSRALKEVENRIAVIC